MRPRCRSCSARERSQAGDEAGVIYDLLESITDRCEDVANIIEGIVIENS